MVMVIDAITKHSPDKSLAPLPVVGPPRRLLEMQAAFATRTIMIPPPPAPDALLETVAVIAKRTITIISEVHVVFPPPAPSALRPLPQPSLHPPPVPLIAHGGLGVDSRTWDASAAPEAARERCGCQLAGAHAALDTKLLVSPMATGKNAKTSKMSRQRLSDCCTVRVHQQR